jgi:hypothetical protein
MDSSLIALATRVAALEAKLAEVYDHLGVIALARAGQRTEAISQLQREAGIDTADALARVDGYLRSIGR